MAGKLTTRTISQAGAWRRTLACLLLVTLVAAAHAAPKKSKTPSPVIRLPFAGLGIPPLSANLLTTGASLLTVNFVDDTHLLVTFGTRGLLTRDQNAAEGDVDRMVTAELVELPDGKVLSHTSWRLHDPGRYLWPLGEGRFLLRIHEDLSTFAPLANLHGEPWERVSFRHRAGELAAVELTADDRLLTVMTKPFHAPERHDANQAAHSVHVTGSGDLVDHTATYVYMDFYRVSGRGSPESPIELRHAGVVRSPEAIRLPIDAEGYLRTQKGPRGAWKVSFESFEGSLTHPLAPVGSTCPPVLSLPSYAQVLAFTCRGIDPDAITIQAYDFAGHETWEEPLGEIPITPTFAYAPAAGRFAMSRLLPAPPPIPGTQPSDEPPPGPTQELRIYQTQSGDLLLQLNATPTFRTAENYDLSPDGMQLVLVRDGELAVYRLPELTKMDREDLEDLRHMRPAASASGPVNLRKLAEDDQQPAPLKDAEGTVEALPAAARPANEGDTASAVASTVNGDANTPPRKPPTLLNPGESADYKPK